MDAEIIDRLLQRTTTAHKYDFGHVLVVGGSPGMVGAPLLAGEAALRIGAGLVTIAAGAAVTDKLERRVREIMTLTLPDEAEEAVRFLTDFVAARRVTAVVIGPGLRTEATALCLGLVQELRGPIVLDAGAFSALHGHFSILKDAARANPGMILTPHQGEYERLTDSRLPSDREQIKLQAAGFAADMGVTLVLKGHRTLVAHPDGALYENQTGNPGLATAGTGDVLAGMIAGLLAQGMVPAQTAEAGVYLHGLAGDLAAAAKTQPGMIASDVTEFLPAALKTLEHQ